ncbi:uncharacterized protein LOC130367446 [Hyla sarda]|uniref:uncharacterized protein LOC130367446 n=1 Tax=Hyla sarda TaxID=327740 RepID=UPI0024C20DF9|nr:uncharacterized protein LOC130367446 [Hyla sarda]
MSSTGDASSKPDREDSRSSTTDIPRKVVKKTKHRACLMCKVTLASDYPKPNCPDCIDRIIAAESLSLIMQMQNMVKSQIESALKWFLPIVAPPQPEVVPSVPIEVEEEEGLISIHSDLGDDSHSSEDDLSGKPLFLTEDSEHLIKAVRSTMGLEEAKEQKSIQDIMFEGIEEKIRSVFPVHRTISQLIKKEWGSPDKKTFIPRAIKRKYPFSDTKHWDRPPKIDVAIAKISRKWSLPFEDLGTFKRPYGQES